MFVGGCVRSAGRGDDRLVARGKVWWVRVGGEFEGLLWVVVLGGYLVLVCLTLFCAIWMVFSCVV